MRRVLLAFLAGLILMAGVGWWWRQQQEQDVILPKDEPKPKVEKGLTKTIETIPVGEVVNAVRSLNRLVVFQAYLTAQSTTHEIGWITQSDQTMLTPAFVNYYVDMDTLYASSIRVQGKDVYIQRPAIRIERPNIDTRNVQVFNSGIWTNLTSTSDRLRISNNKMALRQLLSRAKQPFPGNEAKKAAAIAVAANMQTKLAAFGHPEAVVHVVQ